MKITDLLDCYADDSMLFPAADTPDAETTIARTMEKLALAPRRRQRAPARLLLAACLTVLLAATAAAVGFTVWEQARQDAGLANDGANAAYVEYTDLPNISIENPLGNETITEVENAAIELVSTICAGQNVTAYLRVSPAEQATQEAANGHWDIGGKPEAAGVSEIDGFYLPGIRQLSYDAATQSALVCLELQGAIFEEADTFSMDLFWNDAGSVLHYGRFTLPITPSETLAFPVALPLENALLAETATLSEVVVGANFVRFTLDNPLNFTQWCAANGGQEAWFQLCDAYWGGDGSTAEQTSATSYTELDAQAAFARSWSEAICNAASDTAIVLLDGTEIALDSVQSTGRDHDDAVSWMTEDFPLPTLVDLSQVASLRIGCETFPIAS